MSPLALVPRPRLVLLGLVVGALCVAVLVLVLVTGIAPVAPSSNAEGGDTASCVDQHGDEDACHVALTADSAPTGTYGPLASCPQLRAGDTGDCVRALQRRLRDLGSDVPVTGTFGSRTDAEVRRVQAAAQPPIPASGIVGLRTQLALEKALARNGTGPRSAGGLGPAVVAAARRIMAGDAPGWSQSTVPYVWGGGHGAHPGPTTGTCVGYDGPSPCEAEVNRGLDCSGFTRYAVALAAGRDLLGPGNTDDQRARGTQVHNPLPGDLVLFGSASNTHHVAIYMGAGRIVHAPDTGQDVQIGLLAEFHDLEGFYRIET